MTNSLKPLLAKVFSPSLLETGWGEVIQRQQGFHEFNRTTIILYLKKLSLYLSGVTYGRHCHVVVDFVKRVNFNQLKSSNTHNERIAKMTFASVYPLYLTKVEKKGRTKEELNKVIEWLTGFDNKKQQELIKDGVSFEKFFQHASLNPNAQLITGVICGYRVEEIGDALTQQVRYLDKLVDELAKGRKMEKILRSS